MRRTRKRRWKRSRNRRNGKPDERSAWGRRYCKAGGQERKKGKEEDERNCDTDKWRKGKRLRYEQTKEEESDRLRKGREHHRLKKTGPERDASGRRLPIRQRGNATQEKTTRGSRT